MIEPHYAGLGDMDTDQRNRRFSVITAHSSFANIFRGGAIFEPRHPLFEASVTQALIHLNDLLQRAVNDGSRISFTDDVEITIRDRAADVTDLVSRARNAACHVNSALQEFGLAKLRMCSVAGRQPTAFCFDDVTLGCEYDDDIAVYYGTLRIYLRRHVDRAYREVSRIYPPE